MRWQRWGAAISLVLWFGLSGFQPRVGYTRDILRTAVDLGTWTAFGPTAPWVLAGVACVFSLWRGLRHLNDNSDTRPAMCDRRTGLARLVLCLVSLRLLSLWNPVGIALPWIGLLWSPHVDWAVGLTALTCLLPWGHRPGSPRLDRLVAFGLFSVLSLVYGGYAIYHCQMTMLHGDEGHYLLVTQSLFHDGDVDLADDLERATTDEFHTIPFGPHVAPSSPTGKVISIHPVGLSAASCASVWRRAGPVEQPAAGVRSVHGPPRRRLRRHRLPVAETAGLYPMVRICVCWRRGFHTPAGPVQQLALPGFAGCPDWFCRSLGSPAVALGRRPTATSQQPCVAWFAGGACERPPLSSPTAAGPGRAAGRPPLVAGMA